ncbi:MAG: hypothetical protein M0R03_06180 [Novosphingobium sp.]|nr:hypothetical protein [Novosphingobium sp.]
MITDYHSKYLATELVRRRSSDSSEKLAVAVAGAQVDMNPHQVDAALFAFASPLSKGALLADEVGLEFLPLCLRTGSGAFDRRHPVYAER